MVLTSSGWAHPAPLARALLLFGVWMWNLRCGRWVQLFPDDSDAQGREPWCWVIGSCPADSQVWEARQLGLAEQSYGLGTDLWALESLLVASDQSPVVCPGS